MSAVRVRKSSRAPLAYVPIEPNKVVVVPTDNIPQPDTPSSPANQAFLQSQAEQLASPSTSRTTSRPAPPRLRSRTIDAPFSPPLVTPTRRGATSVLLESRESLVHDTDGDHSTTRRTSWFTDHVMHPMSRSTGIAPSTLGGSVRGDRARASMETTGPDALDSSVQVDVIIPDEVRSDLGRTLANMEREPAQGSNASLAELHHADIVEHLDVIDAHISTVSHLSNAANSILVPPLSFYSRKPVITLPTRLVPPDEEQNGSTDELDRHVEQLLRRRDKLLRSLQGLWAFLKTPIGIVTGIYGFLVVFWGAAIVLFLGKLINLHDDYLQGFWVEISSQVVNGLFTVQGVGFLPWRIMDTWNILWISHYDRLDQKLRRRAGLPPLADPSDIPDRMIDSEHVQVLSDSQLEQLRRHQVRFLKSQTWYRPHATETHRAFSIKYALAICFLNDGNSVFQIILCGCMWGLNRFQRPPWTTGSLIPLSFICGIGAGVVIWKGGEASKKTKEVEERLRGALEQEKRALKERYGAEVAEDPTLLEKSLVAPEVEAASPTSPAIIRESAERKRSPLMKTLNIDENMTIPEGQEEPSATNTPKNQSRSATGITSA